MGLRGPLRLRRRNRPRGATRNEKPNTRERGANGGHSEAMSADTVVFFVAGSPKPKGSHRAFVVRGRAVVAPASTGERAWRDRVTDCARAAMAGREPLEGPVEIRLEFFTLRPKSHYRARKVRLANAETVSVTVMRPGMQLRPTSAPDGDKLWRSVGDALNGVCYRDDRQVCEAVVRKRYTRAEQPYCGVSVTVGPFVGDE